MKKPSLAKRVLALMLGLPAMLIGFWQLSVLTGSLFAHRAYTVKGYLLIVYGFGISGYFIFLSIISLRFAILGLGKSRPGITWWRVIAGTLLIVSQVRGQMAHISNILKPKSAAYALGMWIALLAVLWLAVWLIISGIKTRRPPILSPSADSASI